MSVTGNSPEGELLGVFRQVPENILVGCGLDHSAAASCLENKPLLGLFSWATVHKVSNSRGPVEKMTLASSPTGETACLFLQRTPGNSEFPATRQDPLCTSTLDVAGF